MNQERIEVEYNDFFAKLINENTIKLYMNL